jgi:hypothetical protein
MTATSITLESIVSEANEFGLSASIEYPGFVSVTDAAGRVLHIGTANGSWGVDVFATTTEAADGVPPREGDELSGDTASQLVAHALAVANRVPLA